MDAIMALLNTIQHGRKEDLEEVLNWIEPPLDTNDLNGWLLNLLYLRDLKAERTRTNLGHLFKILVGRFPDLKMRLSQLSVILLPYERSKTDAAVELYDIYRETMEEVKQ